MNLKSSRFISISMFPAQVSAAEVSSTGVVERLVRKAVEGQGVGAALREALSGFDIKKSSILCVIPGDVATTKNIELPSVDRQEIESILSLQVSRFTPFSKDEVLTGYVKLGSSRPNFTRVLLVIVKREAVKERLGWIREAGFKVETVIFVPEAVARFYAKGYSPAKSDVPVGIIDVNRQNTNFIVLARGAIIMSRNISVGTDHLSADASGQKELIEGIQASVDVYGQEGIGPKIEQFHLTSSHPLISALVTPVAEALSAKVSVTPYEAQANFSKTARQSLETDFAGDSALDVIASGVAAVRCEADLVPQEVKDHRIVAAKGRETFRAGVMILVSLILVGGGLLSKVYFKERFLQQNLIEKYAEQRAAVENLENTAAKTRILRQYLEGRNLPLDAIRELFRIIPPQIYLTAISNDDSGNLSLQGISESMSQVFSFVTDLEASPFFDGVKTKSTSAKKDRGKDVASFEIVMKLVTDAAIEAPADPAKTEKK